MSTKKRFIIALIIMIGIFSAISENIYADSIKKVAIIIDDLGNDMKGTEEILNLPTKVNVAIMPFLSTTKRDAELAHQKGIDILVHMPMEPNTGKSNWLGPGAITADLSDEEVRSKVEAAIDDVPYAVGMNNHMGSKITKDRRIMSIVLDVCKERGIFFVDSKTDYKSVVAELSVQKGLPPIENEIFLDDFRTVKHISGQMKLIEKMLEKQDTCVTIGHVGAAGPLTASVIRDAATRWSGKIETVSITEMVNQVWKWNQNDLLPTNNK